MNAIVARRRQRRLFPGQPSRAESAGARVSPPHSPQGGRATDTRRSDEPQDGAEITGVAQTPVLCYAEEA